MSDNFFKVHKGLSLKPINSDPANPIEGDLQFSDGTHREKGLWQYKDGSWTVVGSGSGGGLDVFYTQDFENFNGISSSGNNSSFLGGGGLSGSFSLENTSPIAGNESGKYVAGASSNNDYIEVEAIDLDLKQRDTEIKTRFMADMSNFANDVTFVIYDKTNNAVLTEETDTLPASESRSFYEFAVCIPSTCTQISYGFHMKNGAVNGEEFIFDDIEFSTNPFIIGNLEETQHYRITQDADVMSDRTNEWQFNLGTATIVNQGSELLVAVDDAANTRTQFVAQKDCSVFISINAPTDGSGSIGIGKNGDVIMGGDTASVNEYRNACVEVQLSAGEYITIGCSLELVWSGNLRNAAVKVIGNLYARAKAEHIITPAKGNLTNWESYTPTWSGLGTVTNNFAKWRRVGDTLEVEASVNSGSPNATTATISIPSGLTIDSSKVSSSSQNALGVFAITETATNFTSPSVKEGYLFHDGSDTSNLFLSFRSSADGVMQKDSGGAWFGVGDGAIVKFSVPIAEWSADNVFLAAVPTIKEKVTAHIGYVVGPTAEYDYNTIQAAINAVPDGSKITVSKGTYTENLTINKKVMIEGVGNDTIIDGTTNLNTGADGTLMQSIKFENIITVAQGVKGIKLKGWVEGAGQIVDENTVVKFQTKLLPADINNPATTGVEITNLRFENLTIGKRYRVNLNATLRFSANVPGLNIRCDNGLEELGVCRYDPDDAGGVTVSSFTKEFSFVAKYADVKFIAFQDGGPSSCSIRGNNTAELTYATIEEFTVGGNSYYELLQE